MSPPRSDLYTQLALALSNGKAAVTDRSPVHTCVPLLLQTPHGSIRCKEAVWSRRLLTQQSCGEWDGEADAETEERDRLANRWNTAVKQPRVRLLPRSAPPAFLSHPCPPLSPPLTPPSSYRPPYTTFFVFLPIFTFPCYVRFLSLNYSPVFPAIVPRLSQGQCWQKR